MASCHSHSEIPEYSPCWTSCVIVEGRFGFAYSRPDHWLTLSLSAVTGIPMSDNKSIAVKCFMAGNTAVQKGIFDYAVNMYGTAVKVEPANLMYRQALRAAQQKKFGDNESGASMAKMQIMALKPKLSKARKNKDWKALSEAAEEGLNFNPWDVQCNIELGDALRELDYGEVAVFAYQEAVRREPEHLYANQALADLLAERGDYEQARVCLKRLQKANPNSGALRSKLAAMDATQTLDRGGYDTAVNTQGVLADSEVKRRLKLGEEADAPGMSPELDLQHAIRKDPTNHQNHLKLADLYKKLQKYEDALKHYQQALQLTNNDVNIREVKEDLELDILRSNLERAKEAAMKDKDPIAQKRAADIANHLLLREVEIFTQRGDRYPNDMRLKYELGLRHMRMRNWAMAIPLFQRSVGDNRIKGPSLIALGKCFMYDKKVPIARKQLEMAVPVVQFEDFPDEFKDLHYVLARLCEELKDEPAAIEHFQTVLTVDYNYRDTRTRLEKLQGGDSQGTQFVFQPEE